MLLYVSTQNRPYGKCFKVSYTFCNDYTGDTGGPVLAHDRLFRSDSCGNGVSSGIYQTKCK